MLQYSVWKPTVWKSIFCEATFSLNFRNKLCSWKNHKINLPKLSNKVQNMALGNGICKVNSWGMYLRWTLNGASGEIKSKKLQVAFFFRPSADATEAISKCIEQHGET